MKHTIRLFGIIAVVAVIGFSMASCAGNDPKSLAKQTFDLSIQAMGALLDPSKAAEIEKKAAALEEKIGKLSAKDKAAYKQELTRLTEQALGGLLKPGDSVLNLSKDALDYSQQAQDLLNDTSLKDSLNAAQKALENAQQASDLLKDEDLKSQALDSAKKALNLLGSF